MLSAGKADKCWQCCFQSSSINHALPHKLSSVWGFLIWYYLCNQAQPESPSAELEQLRMCWKHRRSLKLPWHHYYCYGFRRPTQVGGVQNCCDQKVVGNYRFEQWVHLLSCHICNMFAFSTSPNFVVSSIPKPLKKTLKCWTELKNTEMLNRTGI